MFVNMDTPIVVRSASELIGPAYINNTTDRQVIFDGVNDAYGYELLMENGKIDCDRSIVKEDGTYSGVKLTFKVAAKYMTVGTTPTETNITTTNKFYLQVYK